jgi:uncharacterized membrane protein
MENKNVNHEKTRRLVSLALLTAVVIVLQLIASLIPMRIPITLALVPIVLGAVIYGPGAGAFLGAVFGLVVLGVAISGTDQFTLGLLTVSPLGTIAVCLVKGALCGYVAGLIYRVFQRNRTLACLLASISCPIVNTGVFALAMATIFKPTLLQLASGTSALYFLFIVMIGVNFLVELGVNTVLSTVVSRVAAAVLQKRGTAN